MAQRGRDRAVRQRGAERDGDVSLFHSQALLQAQTLEEVKDGLLDACSRLTELEIFISVDVLADKSSGVRHASRGGTLRAKTGRRAAAAGTCAR